MAHISEHELVLVPRRFLRRSQILDVVKTAGIAIALALLAIVTVNTNRTTRVIQDQTSPERVAQTQRFLDDFKKDLTCQSKQATREVMQATLTELARQGLVEKGTQLRQGSKCHTAVVPGTPPPSTTTTVRLATTKPRRRTTTTGKPRRPAPTTTTTVFDLRRFTTTTTTTICQIAHYGDCGFGVTVADPAGTQADPTTGRKAKKDK